MSKCEMSVILLVIRRGHSSTTWLVMVSHTACRMPYARRFVVLCFVVVYSRCLWAWGYVMMTYEISLSFLRHTWWRHQMETFSALLAICAGNSPVTGEFPAQRQVTRSFDVFFDLRPNKRSSKQSWGWWFETLSRPLWHHCNAMCTWWQMSVCCFLVGPMFNISRSGINNLLIHAIGDNFLHNKSECHT